jgi:hypothetical protein
LFCAVTTPSPQPRGPLFWILVVSGVVMTSCCLMTGLLMTLGVLASEPENTGTTRPSTGTTTAANNDFLIAGEVARGTSLTIALPGGAWMEQFGGVVENVVGRSGSYALIQTDSSGSLYELTFDDDGSYVLHWASKLNTQYAKGSSHCEERGAWELEGTQLTLKPASQRCEYSNYGVAQKEEDKDLSERSYTVVDLTLETLNEPKRQFPGVLMSGPRAKWDTGSGGLTLKLQRLN